MQIKSKKNVFTILVIILLAQLGFLYFVKYQNQDISFTEFTLFKTGNLINFFFFAVIVIGFFIIVKRKNSEVNEKVIYTIISLSWLFLILAFFNTKFRIISSNVYVFSQPGDKVLTGLFFLFYLLFLLQLLVYLWSIVLGSKNLNFVKIFIRNILILIIFFIGIVIFVDNAGYTSGKWSLSRNKNNIAIVLGAAVWSGNVPSPTLAARVDKALSLLEEGFVGEIVLTGGKAPGELPESEVAYEYARVNGVDTSLIKIERFTASTSEQIRWIKMNLSTNETIADIIIVSDLYHLPRTIEISRFFNLDVKVAESVHKLNFEDKLYNKLRESIALFNFWNFAL